MNSAYTNVYKRGKFLYLRGIENGRRYRTKLEFFPTVWVTSKPSAESEQWSTMDGRPVFSYKPGGIYETRDYVAQFQDVVGKTVYETTGHVYEYIADTYPGEIAVDFRNILVSFIDIETETERGFPVPDTADERIILITRRDRGNDTRITWGLRPLTTLIPNLDYRCFSTEEELLADFLAHWQDNYPDVISGWNSTFFDVTYLYNRISKVVGEKAATRLSPWGQVYQKTVLNRFDQEATKTYIAGISLLDWLELYMKFGSYSKKESYKLANIAEEEIGATKVAMPCNSFREFYTDHWDKFVSYNVRDVDLVHWLDDEKGLVDLAFSIAYSAKVNFDDVFSPVRCWDNIIYCYLRDQKIVIPPRQRNVHARPYEGAFVKEPLVGLHRWPVSFDLTSLYPHIIMQNNMSPETITNRQIEVTVDQLLRKEVDLSEVHESNFAIAANGWCFTRDKVGILPILMQRYFDLRSTYKKKMLAAKKAKENDPENKALKAEIARYDNLQMAMKILLNSMYGALANVYSRYYDIRIAEGITLTGQLVINWIANVLNAYMNKALKTDNEDYIVLMDTDSVVLTMGGLVDKFCTGKSKEEVIDFLDKISEKVFQGVINKAVEELAEYTNAHSQKMFMKRENIADAILSVSKKHYVMNVYDSEGVRYKQPKLKIVGLEVVKSSTPAVARKALKDIIPLILTGNEGVVQQYVTQQRVAFFQYTPEQIAFPRGVNNLAKYANPATVYRRDPVVNSSGKAVKPTIPIHVRAALLYNHLIKKHKLDLKYPAIRDGDKIRFLYLRMPNPILENVIGFHDVLPEEFGLHQYVDYDIMFDKAFETAVQNFIDPVGWNTKSVGSLADLIN